MDHFFEFINSHKLFVLLILLFLIIGVPFSINLLFKFNFNIEILQAEWNAATVLTFYGNILTFSGTISLSFIALRQTYELHKKNYIRDKNLVSPEFECICESMIENKKFIFKLKNISENTAFNIIISNMCHRDKHGLISNYENKAIKYGNLDKSGTILLEFKGREIQDYKVNFKFKLECMSKAGDYIEYDAVCNGSISNIKALKFNISYN